MKNIKIFLLWTLCVLSLFCFVSCKAPKTDSVASSEISSAAKTEMEELWIAIRKKPAEYNGTQVTLKGTILKEGYQTFLVDYHGLAEGVLNTTDIKIGMKMSVVLSENMQNSLLESYDYVELIGTITVANSSIFLANCECTILVAHEEIE